jgi:hypothetical protein
MSSITFAPTFRNNHFQQLSQAFLDDPSLPFANVLPSNVIEAHFRKYDGLFGGTFYNTAIVLFAFVSQVIADGKSASCFAAVSRIAAHFMAKGQAMPSLNTGDYCKARQKLSEKAIQELAMLIAKNPEIIASSDWLWKGKHHVKLIDGFITTMPDTEENQQEFPKCDNPKYKDKRGYGLPMMRVCAVLSLATAMIMNAAFSKYQGKETGETALLRSMLDSFDANDIAVFDRYCCSFMMLAQFMQRDVQVCTRLHASRVVDFRRGKRLGKDDRLVTWTRPQRPSWMSVEEYETIPETLTLRMVRYSLVGRGRRTQVITVITTLVDPEEYSAEDIAELYGLRWSVELDIRHVKRSLNMDHFRCKSPAMVKKEFWTMILAYNLVRKVICEAATFGGVLPRRLSFTQTCAFSLEVGKFWAVTGVQAEALKSILKLLASLKVPDRPGRYEPRMLKRRRDTYPIMKEPRQVLKNRVNLGVASVQ